MRVIAGSAKSIPLFTPEGDGTRPTTDRIKETLFNMIRDEIYDCRFLDLFSGSGQIGIEALSRGAAEAVFVEKDRKNASLIEKNLEKTKLSENATLIRADVMSALSRQSGGFDIIYMDPPYKSGIENQVLSLIGERELLNDGGMIIIEAELLRQIETDDFVITREKVYKTNKHIFMERI